MYDFNVFITKMYDKFKFLWSNTNRWHKGICIFLFVELKFVPGWQVGFSCNDPKLSYPFTGDTITLKTLFITTVVLPLIIMLFIERKYNSNKVINSKRQALCWYREYLFGALINLIVTELIKLVVRSPRPHFFESCNPKEALTCVGSEFVPQYTCTKGHWLIQSDKSFPSAHTSLALQTAFFLVYYLYRRTKSSSRSNVIISVQLSILVTAGYCSVSRLTDRRHHWWDVLAGAALVPPILYYTIKHLCGDFECSSHANEENDLEVNNLQANNNVRTELKTISK